MPHLSLDLTLKTWLSFDVLVTISDMNKRDHRKVASSQSHLIVILYNYSTSEGNVMFTISKFWLFNCECLNWFLNASNIRLSELYIKINHITWNTYYKRHFTITTHSIGWLSLCQHNLECFLYLMTNSKQWTKIAQVKLTSPFFWYCLKEIKPKKLQDTHIHST